MIWIVSNKSKIDLIDKESIYLTGFYDSKEAAIAAIEESVKPENNVEMNIKMTHKEVLEDNESMYRLKYEYTFDFSGQKNGEIIIEAMYVRSLATVLNILMNCRICQQV